MIKEMKVKLPEDCDSSVIFTEQSEPGYLTINYKIKERIFKFGDFVKVSNNSEIIGIFLCYTDIKKHIYTILTTCNKQCVGDIVLTEVSASENNIILDFLQNNNLKIDYKNKEIVPRFKFGDFVKVFNKINGIVTEVTNKGNCVIKATNNEWYKGVSIKDIKEATDSEREEIFTFLKNNNLVIDSINHKIKYKWWRAKKGKVYYTIVDFSYIIDDTIDDYDIYDDNNYSSGNYFKTRELAEEAVEKIKKVFNQRK